MVSGKIIHVTAGLHFGVVNDPLNKENHAAEKIREINKSFTSISVKPLGINVPHKRREREGVGQ